LQQGHSCFSSTRDLCLKGIVRTRGICLARSRVNSPPWSSPFWSAICRQPKHSWTSRKDVRMKALVSASVCEPGRGVLVGLVVSYILMGVLMLFFLAGSV